MSDTSTLILCTGKITRAELAQVPTPPSTETHVPIPHAACDWNWGRLHPTRCRRQRRSNPNGRTRTD